MKVSNELHDMADELWETAAKRERYYSLLEDEDLNHKTIIVKTIDLIKELSSMIHFTASQVSKHENE